MIFDGVPQHGAARRLELNVFATEFLCFALYPKIDFIAAHGRGFRVGGKYRNEENRAYNQVDEHAAFYAVGGKHDLFIVAQNGVDVEKSVALRNFAHYKLAHAVRDVVCACCRYHFRRIAMTRARAATAALAPTAKPKPAFFEPKFITLLVSVLFPLDAVADAEDDGEIPPPPPLPKYEPKNGFIYHLRAIR